ncbi:DNA transport protein TraD [Klebsiella pneumoniae]|uniref:DNA transport protein TraD n=1 Tax=Klebsiella pneumoniae TaxID=573 RepID=A0A2X1QFK3_KLEPN|nr:DNA transport protein TraD [Klebsiella pneumoniae]
MNGGYGAYEAWQQENHPDIQQQMQRREEVNINVHRDVGDVEPEIFLMMSIAQSIAGVPVTIIRQG